MAKVSAVVLLALSVSVVGGAFAENLDMSVADASSTFDQPGKPTRGMTQDSVHSSYGAPQSAQPAVGDPPEGLTGGIGIARVGPRETELEPGFAVASVVGEESLKQGVGLPQAQKVFGGAGPRQQQLPTGIQLLARRGQRRLVSRCNRRWRRNGLRRH